MLAYTVVCTFKNETLAQEWQAWLMGEHLADVIAAGALDAEVVKMDGTPVRCEVRYHFESRDAFNRYEREHAARLRGEGLKKFPLDRGLSYVRSVGETIGRREVGATTDAPASSKGDGVTVEIVEPKSPAATVKGAKPRGGKARSATGGRRKAGGAKASTSESA
jgi:hypothetical protein